VIPAKADNEERRKEMATKKVSKRTRNLKSAKKLESTKPLATVTGQHFANIKITPRKSGGTVLY